MDLNSRKRTIIMSYDVTDFTTEVLDKSREVPVLVDFWAPWCGPCRVLGPVLERLAAKSAGRWTLAKINTDLNPDVSAQWGIRGIPAVKLFVNGKVTEEFTGALPEPAVRRWLEAALPDDTKRSLAEAEEFLDAGDHVRAERLLGKLLKSNPTHARALIRMAQAVAPHDIDRAVALLPDGEPEPDLIPMVEAIRMLARGADSSALPDSLAKSPFLDAVSAIAGGNPDQACVSLIEALQADRWFGDDAPRKTGVALFTVLGPQHAVTRRYRRTFDMWLY